MRFYGLLGERFCNLDRKYQDQFDECFALHVRCQLALRCVLLKSRLSRCSNST